MQMSNVFISLAVVGAVATGLFGYGQQTNAATVAQNTVVTPPPAVPGSSLQMNTTPGQQNTTQQPMRGPESEEQMAKFRQKLMDIKNLPEDQRAKAMSDFREELMKEQGLSNPTEPAPAVTPPPASPS